MVPLLSAFVSRKRNLQHACWRYNNVILNGKIKPSATKHVVCGCHIYISRSNSKNLRQSQVVHNRGTRVNSVLSKCLHVKPEVRQHGSLMWEETRYIWPALDHAVVVYLGSQLTNSGYHCILA